MSKHYDELFATFVSVTPKIIALCETKIDKNIECLFEIPGYKSFFSSKSSKSGGLVLYIRNEIFS